METNTHIRVCVCAFMRETDRETMKCPNQLCCRKTDEVSLTELIFSPNLSSRKVKMCKRDEQRERTRKSTQQTGQIINAADRCDDAGTVCASAANVSD